MSLMIADALYACDRCGSDAWHGFWIVLALVNAGGWARERRKRRYRRSEVDR